MCHLTVLEFGRAHIRPQDVSGRRVLEVGSYNVNGSLRDHVVELEPAEYIGVDAVSGPGVDLVIDAVNLVAHFGPARFDMVISTEMLEHARDWRKAVSNLKNVLRPTGTLLLTTRSRGFAPHHAPNDFWRYEIGDMREIFGDLEIEVLLTDPYGPGVLMRARRPEVFVERDLSGYSIYSIETGFRR